jgi:hypothetical protein
MTSSGSADRWDEPILEKESLPGERFWSVATQDRVDAPHKNNDGGGTPSYIPLTLTRERARVPGFGRRRLESRSSVGAIFVRVLNEKMAPAKKKAMEKGKKEKRFPSTRGPKLSEKHTPSANLARSTQGR